MTAETSVRQGRRAAHRPPGTVISLGILLSLLVVGAVQGGSAMVINPVDPLGMSLAFLDGAPVHDYFWPGMFLLGIAGASLVTVVGLFSNWSWPWAARIERFVGFRWPWIGAVSTGSILLVFEILELFYVPFHPVMHPLLIVGSLAILLLAAAGSTRSHLTSR